MLESVGYWSVALSGWVLAGVLWGVLTRTGRRRRAAPADLSHLRPESRRRVENLLRYAAEQRSPGRNRE